MTESNDKDDKDDVLATAKQRFAYALERSSDNRARARKDIRFAAASPDDPWQWDERDLIDRKGRPTLTINKMPQHINQVTNDIKQNRPSIKYRPVDNKADPEVAEILNGVVRHIESNSDADVAYDTAAHHEVVHGTGYIRVLADFVSEDSFDQEIFIGRIKNPFLCYDDPDIQDPAGADRRWFFIEERLDEEEFEKAYPDADAIDWNFDGGDEGGWFSAGEKKIRVCEYFEAVEEEAELMLWSTGETSYKGDPLPKGVMQGEKSVKTRKANKCKVIWRKMNGQEILEEKEFPSKFIPFARVLGNEWEVDGKTVISGLVRNAKDSQRMYNTAQSAIVERVMQAPKSPWAAPADAIEGYEQIWRTANTANHSFLPYNHVDDQGQPIPAPSRTSPAAVEMGLSQIATTAADDIKSETGQYDASLGSRSNETSGKAIMARQREGDTATFHYIDNLARGVRHVGRIILDMIPKIYDTKRIARIVGEDGEVANATLDPKNPEALTEYQDDKGAMQRIFNPTIGTYDVVTTTGPSFTTRRVEAVEAMTQMTQANPQLWQVIGDQLVKNMDWPGAEEMAERLKLTLLPEVKAIATKDDKPGAIPPEAQMQMQQMQQHIQEMGQALNNASQQMDQVQGDAQKAKTDLMASRLDKEEARSKLGLEARKLAIEEYRAETERMVAEAAAGAKSHELEMQAIQAMQAAQQSADQQEQEAQDAQAPQEPDNTAALAQAMQGHATALQGLQKTIGNMSQPPPQQPDPAQPATAGFSLPEQQIPQ
jgi:hypothetical protein